MKLISGNTNALIVVATNNYNDFIPSLIGSTYVHFPCKIYLFTDMPHLYEQYNNVEVIAIKNYKWPVIPLLRTELVLHYFDKIKEDYIYMIDAECIFVDNIRNEMQHETVAVLHRNIIRYRDEYNYEDNPKSTAYIENGEKYFCGGFIGGEREHVKRIMEFMSKNIRKDIDNGIRAIWGDESHLNKFYTIERPHKILPPSYMLPEGNETFRPKIVHRNKSFKNVWLSDVKMKRSVNKKDYKLDI